MGRTFQLRRGDNTAVSTFTGAIAEPIYDTDTGELVILNGSVAGGTRIEQKPIASIAALKALATTGRPVGSLINVESHAAGTRVGGGMFRLEAVSTADNNGTIIRPTDYNASTNTKAWVRIFEGAIPPTFFGAIAGLATNADASALTTNTQAMQAWLDLVPTTNGEDAPQLSLPEGRWVINGRLTYKGLTSIQGAGRRKSIIIAADSLQDHMMVPQSWEDNSAFPQSPHIFTGIGWDGNESNRTAGDYDNLIIRSFHCLTKECESNRSLRHGIHLSLPSENSTPFAGSVADNKFVENQYYDNVGSGVYVTDGGANRAADLVSLNEVYSGNGSQTYGQFHSERTAGFVLLNPRCFNGRARYDFNLNDCARTRFLGGNLDHRARDIPTSVGDTAALRIDPGSQDTNQIDVDVIVDVTDNGTTAYNGVFIDSGTNALTLKGSLRVNGTQPASGKPVRLSGTVGGTMDVQIDSDIGWPEAPDYSNLITPTRISSGDLNILDGYLSASHSEQITSSYFTTQSLGFGQRGSSAARSSGGEFFQDRWRAQNDAAETLNYVRWRAFANDVTDGSERGTLLLETVESGSLQTAAVFSRRSIVAGASSQTALNTPNSIGATNYFAGSQQGGSATVDLSTASTITFAAGLYISHT